MQLCEEGPDTLAMMSKPSHSDDDETKFPLPINVTHDSSVPSPGGQIATKHDGIPQDIKSVRKPFPEELGLSNHISTRRSTSAQMITANGS